MKFSSLFLISSNKNTTKPVWGHEVYSHLESDKGVSDGMDCINMDWINKTWINKNMEW